MGMRATIGYVQNDGKTSVVSVQWSTVLDRTLGHFIADAMKSGDDVHEKLREFFSGVTKNGHISSVDIDFTLSDGDRQWMGKCETYGPLVVSGIQGVFKGDRDFYNSESDVPGGSIENYHLDSGSIGAVYREKDPNRIEFFWNNNLTGEVEKRYCGIDPLARFYNNVEKNQSKLKKFGFRDDNGYDD